MISLDHPLIKVNSVTIRVPPHGDSEKSKTTKSSEITPTTKLKVNNNPWIIDGDSGTWTCPICGTSQTFLAIGNSKIKVDDKNACQTGVTFSASHNGTIVSSDVEYDEKINIT